jgi:SAM-dependent methyltransferase
MKLDENYWENRYRTAETGWDVGRVSTPLLAYFNQLTDRNLRILIPGCGNGYEAEFLFLHGFKEVIVLDIAASPLQQFKQRVPAFPSEHLIHADFFHHNRHYDLIVEQTFFCALHPDQRAAYAKKMFELLKPGGKLVGLLFDDLLTHCTPPPFGGTPEEYRGYFNPYFDFQVFERCYNSIEPRKSRELFMILHKKTKRN